MIYKNAKILFIALDGREFMVDTSQCETIKDVQEQIKKLREIYNCETPEIMAVLNPNLSGRNLN